MTLQSYDRIAACVSGGKTDKTRSMCPRRATMVRRLMSWAPPATKVALQRVGQRHAPSLNTSAHLQAWVPSLLVVDCTLTPNNSGPELLQFCMVISEAARLGYTPRRECRPNPPAVAIPAGRSLGVVMTARRHDLDRFTRRLTSTSSRRAARQVPGAIVRCREIGQLSEAHGTLRWTLLCDQASARDHCRRKEQHAPP
jgi:hypothetical protein